jgi:hypothetical protein
MTDEEACATCDNEVSDVLLRVVEDAIDQGLSIGAVRSHIVAEVERCYVVRLLARHGGNAARAAAAAGLAERYFRQLKARHAKSALSQQPRAARGSDSFLIEAKRK